MDRHQVLTSLWLAVCLGVAGGLACCLRLFPCRLCGGAGRLALEAQPPDEPAFHVDLDCVGCDGYGRMSVIDPLV